MLNGQHHDLAGQRVDRVVDEIGIRPNDELADAIDRLSPARLGNATMRWSDRRIAVRTRKAAAGFRSIR